MSKYAGEVEAYRAASELANRLSDAFGANWQIRVWENLGWHISVSHGHLEVHPDHSGRYFTLLGKYGGLPAWTSDDYFDTPEEAVEAQLKCAWERIGFLISLIPGLTVVEGYSHEEEPASPVDSGELPTESKEGTLSHLLKELCSAQDEVTHCNEMGPSHASSAPVALRQRNCVKGKIVAFVDGLEKKRGR